MYRGREVTDFGNFPKFCHFFLLLPEKEICFEWLEEQTLTHVFGDFFGAVPTIYCGGGGGEDGSKILAFSADPLGRLPYCEMYEST